MNKRTSDSSTFSFLSFPQLSNNLLTGTIPTEFSRLRDLQLLWLDDNMLEGDVSTTFNRMPFLRALFLEDNDFVGAIDDKFLRRSKNLIQLDVSNNRLTGSLPYHFFVQDEFVDLEVMDWHGNKLSGHLPDMLLPNQILQFLALYDNEFTGTLPNSWGTHLRNVFHLDLSHNLIEGELPSSIGQMSRLKRLFLGNNNWKPGPFPSSWSSLSALEELSLKGSMRTGLLPDFLGEYPQLVFLDLDNNRFDGTVPTSLGQLSNLELLLLNRNRLIGVIPPEFSHLTKLRAVLLEGNYIMGKADPLCGLPNFVDTQSGNLAVVVTDCEGDNSTLSAVECECCTLCCSAAPLLHVAINEDESNNDATVKVLPSSNGTALHDVSNNATSVPTGRPTCHDYTMTANLNPRWELVYTRDSYTLGERLWFNVDNPKRERRLV